MGYGTVEMNLHQEPKGEGTLGGFQWGWGDVFLKHWSEWFFRPKYSIFSSTEEVSPITKIKIILSVTTVYLNLMSLLYLVIKKGFLFQLRPKYYEIKIIIVHSKNNG